MSHCTPTNVSWPCDREAVRFVILSDPDRRGLQRIRSLFWIEGERRFIEKRESRDGLIASALRRGVVFDVIDTADLQHAA